LVTFVSFTSEEPFEGATVKACGELDFTCAQPLGMTTTDATGLATVSVPAGLSGFDGYLDVTGGKVAGARRGERDFGPGRGQEHGIAHVHRPARDAHDFGAVPAGAVSAADHVFPWRWPSRGANSAARPVVIRSGGGVRPRCRCSAKADLVSESTPCTPEQKYALYARTVKACRERGLRGFILF
jgi:hypothetical protein